jgi:hypothetical protein
VTGTRSELAPHERCRYSLRDSKQRSSDRVPRADCLSQLTMQNGDRSQRPPANPPRERRNGKFIVILGSASKPIAWQPDDFRSAPSTGSYGYFSLERSCENAFSGSAAKRLLRPVSLDHEDAMIPPTNSFPRLVGTFVCARMRPQKTGKLHLAGSPPETTSWDVP